MEARVSGERPNEEGRGTGEKNQWNEGEYGPLQRVGPTREGWEVGR